MVVQRFMKMLIFILLCVVHGEQLMEKSPKGPRERNTTLPIQLGKVSSLENTVNIEIHDGATYTVKSKNSTGVAHITRTNGKLLFDYQIHNTSFAIFSLLMGSTLLQIVNVAISIMLLVRRPRYIPVETNENYNGPKRNNSFSDDIVRHNGDISLHGQQVDRESYI